MKCARRSAFLMFGLVILLTATLSYANTCGVTYFYVLSTDPGIISSPGYPSNYDNNLNCTYYIVGFFSYSWISISIRDLDLDCNNDFIAIYNGSTEDSSTLIYDSRLNCRNLTLYIEGEEFTLSFFTDNSVVKRGFKISYSFFVPNCDNVSVIPYGYVNHTKVVDSEFGIDANTLVTYGCYEGYVLFGDRSRHCTPSGDWSGQEPTCDIVDCKTPPNLGNGTIDYVNGTTYGKTAIYSCITGFNLAGNSTRACMTTGNWSGSAPECEIVDCKEPPNLGNGTADTVNGTTYGKTATYTCNPGFKLSGISTRVCTTSGNWSGSAPECKIVVCRELSNLPNGNVTTVEGTEYGKVAVYDCNVGYSMSGNSTRQCMSTAEWTGAAPTCSAIQCDPLANPANGSVELKNGRSYAMTAYYSCKAGFRMAGNATRQCSLLGTWTGSMPTCTIMDCNEPDEIQNGKVNLTKGRTTYGAIVVYICDDENVLLGSNSRKCDLRGNTAAWFPKSPVCKLKEEAQISCSSGRDSRGTYWNQAIADTVHWQPCDGSAGNITRQCSADGSWELPVYGCVRESVTQIQSQVSSLSANTSEKDLGFALETIANVTAISSNTGENETLTEAEISVVTSSLYSVAKLINASTSFTENIAKSFMESTSNLIDSGNEKSWRSLKAQNTNAAEMVLLAVDTFGTALTKQLKSSGNNITSIVKPNIAMQVAAVKATDIFYPGPYQEDKFSETDSWVYDANSSIFLPATTFGNQSYVVTTVIYRNMSNILPSRMENSSLSSQSKEINGPILAVSIDPEILHELNPPLELTFYHFNWYRNSSDYWCMLCLSDGAVGYWSSEGCTLKVYNNTHSVCECTHLTNFAILMSPFVQPTGTERALRIISLVSICVSIVGLVITILLHMCLWRIVRSDRATLLMNLCGALLVAYLIFLAAVDRTESKGFCTVVAALLHYFFLAVFFLMLAEGVDLLITVIAVFSTRTRIKKILGFAWACPLVIVAISLGVTKTEGYGNDTYCWLSLKHGLIWAFVGPALTVILINVVCLVIVFNAMRSTKAMQSKKTKARIATSLRSLAVLLPVTGVSWILGVFYIDDSAFIMQYLFAICNGLQGFFIFVFHCLLNTQVKNALHLAKRRRSSSRWKSDSETMKTSVRRRFSSILGQTVNKTLPKKVKIKSPEINQDYRNSLNTNNSTHSDKGRRNGILNGSLIS